MGVVGVSFPGEVMVVAVVVAGDEAVPEVETLSLRRWMRCWTAETVQPSVCVLV